MLVVLKHRQVSLVTALVWILLLVFSVAQQLNATDPTSQIPAKALLPGFPTVKQLPNHCGPAALSSVLQFWGRNVDQKTISRAVFDWVLQATNGADLLVYARDSGYSAYSWNSSIEDVKKKLSAGMPVIVLQDSSTVDSSGHFRVAIGYDEEKQVVHVMDPYDINSSTIPYAKFRKLWESHGNWSLIIIPESQDKLKKELDEENPVVHIDLAYVYYRKGKLSEAGEEGRKALALEPRNPDALSLVNKVKRELQYAAGTKTGDKK